MRNGTSAEQATHSWRTRMKSAEDSVPARTVALLGRQPAQRTAANSLKASRKKMRPEPSLALSECGACVYGAWSCMGLDQLGASEARGGCVSSSPPQLPNAAHVHEARSRHSHGTKKAETGSRQAAEPAETMQHLHRPLSPLLVRRRLQAERQEDQGYYCARGDQYSAQRARHRDACARRSPHAPVCGLPLPRRLPSEEACALLFVLWLVELLCVADGPGRRNRVRGFTHGNKACRMHPAL